MQLTKKWTFFSLLSAFVIGCIGTTSVTAFAPNEKNEGIDASNNNLSPSIIYAELKERGVDPLSGSADKDLRRAFVSYDFVNGSGHNFNASKIKGSKSKLNSEIGKTALLSTVSVSTAKPGARIRYQLIGDDNVKSIPLLSNSSEDTIPIGIYNFWAEREGKKTSKPLNFRIVRPTVPIQLEENK